MESPKKTGFAADDLAYNEKSFFNPLELGNPGKDFNDFPVSVMIFLLWNPLELDHQIIEIHGKFCRDPQKSIEISGNL